MSMDISAADITMAELFKALVSNGPSTVYSIAKHEVIPQPTVHRTFKKLVKLQAIQVYIEDKATGRTKIFYGPTLNGIFGIYCLLDTVQEENIDLELVFDTWIKEDKFFDELEQLFDPNDLRNAPAKVRRIFKKFVKHNALALREFEKFIAEHGDIPFPYKINLGAALLREKNPEKYESIARELYKEMPLVRQQMEDEDEVRRQVKKTLEG